MLVIESHSDLSRLFKRGLSDRVNWLLTLRRNQLAEFCDDLQTRWIIVGPGDALAAIEAVAGYPFGPAPPWEWVLNHAGIYEAPIILSDDGSGAVLIVPDQSGVDRKLLHLLRHDAVVADLSGNAAPQEGQTSS